MSEVDATLYDGMSHEQATVELSTVVQRSPLALVTSPAYTAVREPRRATVHWLRWGTAPYLLIGDLVAFTGATLLTRPASPLHLMVLPIFLFAFLIAGLYRSRVTLSLLDDFPTVLGAVIVGVSVKLAVFALLARNLDASRQLVHACGLLLAVLLVRGLAYAVVRHARRAGIVRHRTVVVGAGDVGLRLVASMMEHPECGLEPVGFVDEHGHGDMSPLPVPHLGGYDQLRTVIAEHHIRNVIVAFGEVSESGLVDIISDASAHDVKVFWVPRLFELHNVKRDTDHLWGIPLVRSRQAAFRSPWWPLKRLIDVLISAGSLLLLAPLLAACALAVRREGGPGVIFRQERVGLDGKPFEVLKFRSLKPVDNTESQTQWNIKHDDRLGPVGRFIRATSLDELPQLWNILRGEMSLVGPRPERPHFVSQFSTHIPRYTARHRVPVGLTGWAQAHGLRGDTSIEDRARFDNYYIENWSPWLDIKIVIKTVGQVLGRQGG